jgi:hypothetical protein
MQRVTAAPSGGIFISYRRQDASHLAGRLYDRLADRFGDGQIFMDVDTIELGRDFAEVIAGAIGGCQVLLALIGPRWLAAAGQDGRGSPTQTTSSALRSRPLWTATSW